jgi:16S rRNA processing protein RimM
VPDDKVQIGFVLRAHGVRGALRVRGDGEVLLSAERVWLGERAFDVRRAQRERGEFLVELEGVRDRDAAEALKGAPVFVARDALPPPSEDEVYVADLLGCAVFDLGGRRLGEVVAASSNGAQELLTVSGHREWLLPFVDGIVTEVDVAARRIVCDPPPGLIDLDEAESER